MVCFGSAISHRCTSMGARLGLLRDRRKEGDKAMSYNYGVIAAIVFCNDCEWKTESYKNAQALAKIHAKRYGHRVSGELVIAFHYDHRQKMPKETSQT